MSARTKKIGHIACVSVGMRREEKQQRLVKMSLIKLHGKGGALGNNWKDISTGSNAHGSNKLG